MKRLLLPAFVALTSFGAAAATAAVVDDRPRPQAAQKAEPKVKYVTVKGWPRGPGGVTGARGPTGPEGPPGDGGTSGGRGPKGSNPVRAQSLSINWQNGQSGGRDRARFVAPGIGDGSVECTRDSQMLRFRPATRLGGAQLWVVRRDDRFFVDDSRHPPSEKPFAVRTTVFSQFTGDEANEGMNLDSGVVRGQGSFTGLISDATARPTSFRLAYHWNFADGNDRCYVAGTFITETP